jgi:hypothetical protein
MVAYLIVLLLILVAVGIGCLFFPRRRLHLGLKPLNAPIPEPPAEPAAPAPKQPPAFLEELQSKERSIFVDSAEMERSELDLREVLQKEKTIAANPATDSYAGIGIRFAGKKKDS